MLEADIEFTYFTDMVNWQYTKQALIAWCVIIFISFLLIPYTRKILKEDERQKKLFMEQKLLIEEAHREIKDSISYAKRIQSAILPSTRIVNDCFKDAFILYKPKDIVAGDFYWIEKTKNEILFAACDCTGHGVPGAFMSLIGMKILNQSIKQKDVNSPAEALDCLNAQVYDTMNNHASEDNIVRDGMDAVLFAINFNKLTLNFAGANNPLFIIRDKEVIELKADKQPIGAYEAQKPFENTSFNLQPPLHRNHEIFHVAG